LRLAVAGSTTSIVELHARFHTGNKKPALVRFRGEAWRVLLTIILLLPDALTTGGMPHQMP
jgi:hypothetical protein